MLDVIFVSYKLCYNVNAWVSHSFNLVKLVIRPSVKLEQKKYTNFASYKM